MRKTRRSLKNNNKSRRAKRAGAPRHHTDDKLSKAYRYIYQYDGDKDGPHASYWLNEYLKDNEGSNDDDYKKVKKINDMLLEGHRMMRKGYDEFEELMTTSD